MLKKFIEIFDGLKHSHGISKDTGVIKEGNKKEFNSFCIHKQVTDNLYKNHLDGIKPTIGIYPINEQSKCKFGCVDIDTYPVDHLKIIKILKDNKIPAIVFKSKSNGAHIYLFTKEFVQPSLLRIKLRAVAALLGKAKAEVFPKQDYLSEGETGSFLNLPYDGGNNTNRYALDDNANKLTLEQFIEAYDKNALTENQLMDLFEKNTEDDDWIGAPPCLISILKEKQSPGEMRNIVLFNVATYLKKRFPNEWKSKLMDYNKKYCEPPLPENELQATVQKSQDKKDFNYECKKEPLISYCQAKKCRLQKFGVGKTMMPLIIEGIQIYKMDPPLFKVTVDGEIINVKAEELNDPKLFANAALRQIYKTYPSVPVNMWREMVSEHTSKKEFVDDMPESLQIDVILEELLLEYFKHTPGTELKHINISNRSYVDHENKICYFKQKSLQDYLKKTAWEKKWPETSLLLKKYYTIKTHNNKIDGISTRYWSLEKGKKELLFEGNVSVKVNKLKPAPYER